jgi:hypothetical protein
MIITIVVIAVIVIAVIGVCIYNWDKKEQEKYIKSYSFKNHLDILNKEQEKNESMLRMANDMGISIEDVKEYYYLTGKDQNGPFTIEELMFKGLTHETLVWYEGMGNWVEAVNVAELQELIKKIPPPIPTKPEKTLKVEAEISKKKEKLISPKTEVVVAKETKSVFKQILYGLIIGVVSFPIFYFVVYEADKFDNFNVAEKIHIDGNYMTGIDVSEFPFTCYMSDNWQSNIERRKEILTEKSQTSAFFTFLIASGILVVFRFVLKGAKWVQETSNKEI